MHVLSDRKRLNLVFTYLVLLWGIIGLLMLIARPFFTDHPGSFLISTALYFTTQSNILVTIVPILILKGFSHTQWFKNLALITLVNIVMTGTIFHIILTPYMNQISFMNHVLHTINPILYVILYFFFLEQNLKLKSFWITLIYPLIYALMIYIVIEPLLGDMLQNIMPDFVGARYVYPFLDPTTYESGVTGLLIFNVGILAPIICFTTLILMFLKQKLNQFIQ